MMTGDDLCKACASAFENRTKPLFLPHPLGLFPMQEFLHAQPVDNFPELSTLYTGLSTVFHSWLWNSTCSPKDDSAQAYSPASERPFVHPLAAFVQSGRICFLIWISKP